MTLKRLLFAPLFLIVFAFVVLKSSELISTPDLLLSLSLEKYLEIIYLALLVLLSSFLFVLVSTFTTEFLVVLIISLIAGVLGFMFLSFGNALVFALGITFILSITFLQAQTKLKNYLTFDPNLLLSSSVKNLATLLILIISGIFYLNINQTIKRDGFTVPDPLIETAINFSGQTQENETEKPSNLQITPELITQARQNPAVLRQFGLTLKDLEDMQKNQTSSGDDDLTKSLIKTQINKYIEPYLDWIPAFLSLILFISLISFLNLLTIFLPPLIFSTFKILEQTGYIKYEKR